MKLSKHKELKNERNALLIKNTISGILLQIVTVLCGFILPRSILKIYGSEVNGLVNSISQFLQMIAFAELGMGAVIKSALYKPLSENNYDKISEIMAAGSAFFRKIGILLIVYVIVLCFSFPVFIDKNNTFWYDALLIGAISISFFTQYYFGLVDRLFINAAQKGYIQNNIYIVTLIINTVACYMLIHKGFSIHSVKLLTSIIFLFRPILIRAYINANYTIDRKATFRKNTIKQKWNGVAQHIAAIVLDSTDTIVLSVFSTLSNVSIYSVYNIVISGLKGLLSSAFGGIAALMGDLWAKQEKEELNKYFDKTEHILHLITTILWVITYKLIVPFVMLYTNDVVDVNYNVPEFAFVICLASIFNCYRLSYNYMILAAGHYKQTQHIFIIAALINLISSIIFVKQYGLIGVALGTLLAILYQHLMMQWYCIRKLEVYSYKKAFIQNVIDVVSFIISLVLTGCIKWQFTSWISWIIGAVLYSIIIVLVCCIAFIIISFFFGKNVSLIICKKR